MASFPSRGYVHSRVRLLHDSSQPEAAHGYSAKAQVKAKGPTATLICRLDGLELGGSLLGAAKEQSPK